MSQYTIKPLKWKRQFNGSQQKYTAETEFGSFEVSRWKDCEGSEYPWRWSYCFREYYDEASAECRTASEGKRLAEEEWERRIKACLSPSGLGDMNAKSLVEFLPLVENRLGAIGMYATMRGMNEVIRISGYELTEMIGKKS